MSDNDLIRRGDALKIADDELKRYGFGGIAGGRCDQMRLAIHTISSVTPADYTRGFAAGIEAAARDAVNFAESRPLICVGRPVDIVRGRFEGEQAAAHAIAKSIRSLTPDDAPPEPVVRLKPLVWEEMDGRSYRQANCVLGQYQVTWLVEFECWQLRAPLKDGAGWRECFSQHAHKDAAKAAAQADYEARILDAIECVTEADVRADERAKVIAEADRSLTEVSNNGRGMDGDTVAECWDAIDALHTPASRAAAEKGGAA